MPLPDFTPAKLVPWICVTVFTLSATSPVATGTTAFTASSSAPDWPASGAADGDRFAAAPGRAWRAGSTNGWWQVTWDPPRPVGAILQVAGDHEFVLRNAPRDYVWQFSADGESFADLPGTAVADERRLYRVFRLPAAVTTRALRLVVRAAHGDAPVLREVEFPDRPDAPVAFPDWLVLVNSTHDPALPGHGQEFLPLARAATGDAALAAQQVWVGDLDPALLAPEPRPLAVFFSGSFKDWCEVDRATWRGAEAVLKDGDAPLWASCGGAQALAILWEAGTARPWDCPHCRDPRAPKLPIYTHLGHVTPGPHRCGDYAGCVFERGPTRVRQTGGDPAFAGLPEEFAVMQSHCGQIAYVPDGWERVATAGAGSLTTNQCLRLRGPRPVHAAQFHIEMDGTPESSRRIMANFLREARKWRERRIAGGSHAAPAD